MAPELTPGLREQAENTIRFLAVDAVESANSGHPGAPMGLARPAFLLWDKYLRFDEDSTIARRDRAIAELFYSSGLRLAELAAVNIDDIDPHSQLLTVTGKGNKTRTVPVGAMVHGRPL